MTIICGSLGSGEAASWPPSGRCSTDWTTSWRPCSHTPSTRAGDTSPRSPMQAGSGMRAYATLMLPALVLTGRLAGTAVELAAQRTRYSPLWGRRRGCRPGFQSGSQGKTESEIVQQIGEICPRNRRERTVGQEDALAGESQSRAATR